MGTGVKNRVLTGMGFGVVVFFMLLSTSCKGLKIQSQWLKTPIKIDGLRDDWENKTVYVESEQALIGVQNDGKFLYLMMTSGRRLTQRQIMRRGLVVWFGSADKDSTRWGIHFPLASSHKAGSRRREKPGSEGPRNMEKNIPAVVEILGPKDGDVQKFDLSALPGIEVKTTQGYGELVYELRVPLKKDAAHPFAIPPTEGKPLKVELITPELKAPSAEGRGTGRPGGSRRPGGFPGTGRRGGFGGGGQSIGAPAGPGVSGSFKMKLEILLADSTNS